YVREHGGHPQVRHWPNQVADEIGEDVPDEVLITTLQTWIDEDRKHTAPKALQGMIWEDGYRTADFSAHIYTDAATQLQAWHAEGIPLYVYSSGSVPAQNLFSAHADAGDLSGLVGDWFDTAWGATRYSSSYRRTAERTGVRAPESLFLSDVSEQLDAAKRAGRRTALPDRLQDYPVPRSPHDVGSHERVQSCTHLVL
ncbi:acireductone synthase, partial [Xanthomonas campestris]|uniref:acireductone synthase n=1 Tax=Xanthomonas campestris TaxID=339 RepID=UPI00403A529E